MNIRKIAVICAINIIFLISIYFGLNYIIKKFPNYDSKISFLEPNYKKNIETNIEKYETEEIPQYFTRLNIDEQSIREICNQKRFVFGKEYKKNPIVVLGCSYTYGIELKKEKTFPYILSKLTQRPVYSFSRCGSDALYASEGLNSNIKNIEKSDYVIYVYMWDHINRVLTTDELLKFYNRNKYNKITKIDKLLEKFQVFHFINMKLKKKQIIDEYPNSEKSSLYYKNVILYMYEQVKKYTPKAKLIIVIYDEKIPLWHESNTIKYVSDIMNSHIWKDLEAETKGEIQVVHTKDIMGFVFDKEWKLKADVSDWHPNSRVWESFTPLFVQDYIK